MHPGPARTSPYPYRHFRNNVVEWLDRNTILLLFTVRYAIRMVSLIHCLSVSVSVTVLMVAYPKILTTYCQWTHSVYVDPNTGSDSKQCVRGSLGTHDSCATLEYAISMLDNSTKISLVSGNHSVSTKIRVSNHHHIAITGMDPDTTIIQCTDGSNAGFIFVCVSDIEITGLKFVNCGHIFNSTTKGISETMALFRSAVA